MSAWQYEEILLCQRAYADANRIYPRGWDSRKVSLPGDHA